MALEHFTEAQLKEELKKRELQRIEDQECLEVTAVWKKKPVCWDFECGGDERHTSFERYIRGENGTIKTFRFPDFECLESFVNKWFHSLHCDVSYAKLATFRGRKR